MTKLTMEEHRLIKTHITTAVHMAKKGYFGIASTSLFAAWKKLKDNTTNLDHYINAICIQKVVKAFNKKFGCSKENKAIAIWKFIDLVRIYTV